jgi:uncharacterized membrane protein
MAESLLDRVRGDIRARLKELEPSVKEYERLEPALAALRGVGDTSSANSPRVGAAKATGKRRPRKAPSAKRAPRGANRAAVLAIVAARPGVSVAELVTASGVSRPVLYNLLKTLEERGEVQREELPGGAVGYRLGADSAQPKEH